MFFKKKKLSIVGECREFDNLIEKYQKNLKLIFNNEGIEIVGENKNIPWSDVLSVKHRGEHAPVSRGIDAVVSLEIKTKQGNLTLSRRFVMVVSAYEMYKKKADDIEIYALGYIK